MTHQTTLPEKPEGGFPLAIDNTIREAVVTCMTKARYRHIQDLMPMGASVHLHAGGALAAGLEAARRAFYADGRTAPEAVELGVKRLTEFYGDFDPPQGSYKTLENMQRALRYYFSVAWPMEHDTLRPANVEGHGLGVEWRFKVPIPDLVHPDHGGPIYYCGRGDVLGDLNGLLTIEDDKSASSLGESWMKQWALDSQFTGYVWAAQQLGIMPRDSVGPVLVRGVSILKPKYNKKTDEYDITTSFGHAQVITYRGQWMIDRWLRQLQRDISRFIAAYLNNEWDYAIYKGACAAYGGCPYALLCSSPTPEEWVDTNYERVKWDPLAP